MKYLTLFILLFFCKKQEKQGLPELINTRWEYKVAQCCTDYIFFKKDSTYEDYNCEIDFPFSGKYNVKKDTIYMTEIGLSSELPGEKRKIIKAKYKGIIINEKLKFVYVEKLEDGKWIKENTPQGVVYEKVVNK